MKKRKIFIGLLVLIFFACLVPLVMAAVAAESLKEIKEMGFLFNFSVTYVVLFISSFFVNMSEKTR